MTDYSKLSDRELLEGDPLESGKTAELISRYMKTVFACAKKYSACADYDELVSDGMEGLLAAIRGYDPEKGEFSAFVSVCVNNRLRNTAKRSRRRSARLSDKNVEELESIADPAPTPEEIVIARENNERLMKRMRAELTSLELSCIEGAALGLSYEETAQKLGVDKKAVDNALSRARAKLKNHYSTDD